jgi:hypothetical protein
VKLSPFANRSLRDWTFKGVTGAPIGLEDVSTLGAGPFETEDFDEFLRKRKIDAFAPDGYTEMLILGRSDWIPKDLQALLRKRSGRTLRVYSQEMFLFLLLSRRDALEIPKLALKLGRGHPGLEYLQSVGFAWPTTTVKGFGGGQFGHAEWRSEGFLRAVGYRVAHGSKNERAVRRRALIRAYGARVPKRFGVDYAEQWGPATSSARLESMVNSIARFCRLGKGRGRAFANACTRWERDLRWLKRKYYVGRYRFNWPSVEVG